MIKTRKDSCLKFTKVYCWSTVARQDKSGTPLVAEEKFAEPKEVEVF